MDLRVATPADAPEVHGLLLAAFAPFQGRYTPGCYDATVLDARRVGDRIAQGPVWLVGAGRAVGTLSAVRDASGVYLRGMAVHPSARRQGAGRALLEAAESWARGQRAARLWLSTTPFLTGSIALYRAFGFQAADGPADLHGTALRSFEKPLR